MSWSAAAPPVGAGGRSPAPPGGRIRTPPGTACCVPQKPRGVGGGASGRRRGHQGGAPRWGWCPYRETPELLAPPAMRGRSEKTRSVNQEVGSRQTLHPLGPRLRPASRRKGGRHPPAARKPPRRGSCRGSPHRPRQKPRRAEGPTKKLLFGTGRQKAGLRGAGGAEGRGVHTCPSRELRRCRGGQGVHFIINTCG